MRAEDTPTEPIEAPFPDVECAICRVETGAVVTFRLFDVDGMRAHLRNQHSPAFTLSVQFPDQSDSHGPSFDFGE